MKFAKSNKPQGRNADTEARLAALLESGDDAGESILGAGPIVLMTRVRLARNLSRFPFTGWAKEAQRSDILAECTAAVRALPQMKKGIAFTMEELSDHEKQLLVERHLISRELSASKAGSGVVISREDLSASIWTWYRDDNGQWQTRKTITIPAQPAAEEDLPPLLEGFKAVPPLVTDSTTFFSSVGVSVRPAPQPPRPLTTFTLW